MKILYLGENWPGSTSLHRAEAFRRLGHEVVHVNLKTPIPRARWAVSLGVRTGYRAFQPFISRHLWRSIGKREFDLLWLNCTGEIGPGILRKLRRQCRQVAGYMNDDPFGGRDGRKWDLFKQCLPQYDLLAVVRPPNIQEALRAGARRVARVFMSCDPVAHAPVRLTDAERRHWGSEVVFVGNWFPERGPFLRRLHELGVPLSVFGGDWQFDPDVATMRKIWKGPPAMGKDYVRVIQSAKIALGLLSKGNRDLHTTRSAEVPYIGGAVLCAERTAEHEMLYRDGEEAVFWNTPEECAASCKRLLEGEAERRNMSYIAREKIMRWRLTNDEVLAALLRLLQGKCSDHSLVTDCSIPRTQIRGSLEVGA